MLIWDVVPVKTMVGENDKTWMYMGEMQNNYLKPALVVHPDEVVNGLCSTAEKCVKNLSNAFKSVKVFSEKIIDWKYGDDVK